MHPLISVIVPVYNVEEYLLRCVNSIQNQSYRNIEILLIDDGSTDNSSHICDELSFGDRRITVIHKCNGGLSDARNRGLSEARGQLISFVDSDDFIHRDMYQIMYHVMSKYDCDIVETNYKEVDKEVTLEKKSVDYNVSVFEKKYALVNTIMDHYCKNYVWNKLYKRSLWNKIRFPYGKVYEDVFTTHKVVNLASKVAKVDIVLYYYFQRKGSIDKSVSIKNNSDHCEAIDEMIKFVQSNYQDLLPLVSIKYCDERLYRLYELIRKNKTSKDLNQVIEQRMLNILRCTPQLKKRRQIEHLCRKYLLQNYNKILLKRKKVLFELFLLKHSLKLFCLFRSALIFIKSENKMIKS